MPSPFPGMDPYLEAPSIWPDLHDRLATEISAELNRILPGAYYARIEMRPEVGIVEDESSNRRRIVPDVAVVRRPKVLASEAVAVIERPRRELSVALEVEFRDEPIRHHFVEIRDVSQHRLVTLIEILSPSNKRPGPDRDAYARKQREVLDSDASLVEIDLLRDGRRILSDKNLELFVSTIEPAPSYLVLINDAWTRSNPGQSYRVYSIGLRDALPCVGIPLKAEEGLVPIDLQYILDRAYDAGPYRRGAVDYAIPPTPPLTGEDVSWAEAILTERAGPAAPEPTPP